MRAAAKDFGSLGDDRGDPQAALRRVARARALIAAEPQLNRSIAELAAEAACSPFHLARLFRRHTGMSLRGYRLRLRLALALERLADGASDLTQVALDAGFSDHSHLATTFRKALGATPSELRGRVKLSKFLKAA
jgi:AraC family transcriptional regulator